MYFANFLHLCLLISLVLNGERFDGERQLSNQVTHNFQLKWTRTAQGCVRKIFVQFRGGVLDQPELVLLMKIVKEEAEKGNRDSAVRARVLEQIVLVSKVDLFAGGSISIWHDE